MMRLSCVVLLLAIACVPGARATRAAPQRGAADDEALRTALEAQIPDGIPDVRYFRSFVELNGDGRDEAIAYLVGPQVCGSGGCDTFVFSETDAGYRLVCEIGLTRPPIYAAPDKTNGWRDLVVFVAGGGILPGHFVRLRFDGNRYPGNPTVAPATRVKGRPRGTVLVRRFKFYTEGSRPLRPASIVNKGRHSLD